ncbi:MAG: hypothetical protein R3B06_20440 [Kofleriaceae bacterium]
MAALTVEHDHLRLAYQNLQHELALLRRRLFLAKAERLDTAQLELEFATKLRELDDLQPAAGRATTRRAAGADQQRQALAARCGQADWSPRPATARPARGRIELTDPVLEGTATRIDWEESCKLSWRRAGFVRLVAREVP